MEKELENNVGISCPRCGSPLTEGKTEETKAFLFCKPCDKGFLVQKEGTKLTKWTLVWF